MRWGYTAFSFLVSQAVYTYFFGFFPSLLFLVMLLMHEFGHVAALYCLRIEFFPPIFVPFVGAAINLDPNQLDRKKEAIMAIAGPLTGGCAAFVLLIVWLAFPHYSKDIPMMGMIAVYMNALNMIPASPLDGGRIAQLFGRWAQYVGVVLLVAFALYMQSPLFMFVSFIAGMEIARSRYDTRDSVSVWVKMVWFGYYLLLLGFLALLFVAYAIIISEMP